MRVTDRVTAVTIEITMEMRAIVRRAAEPWTPGDSVKVATNRAARALGLTPRRATTLWYGRQTSVLAREADALRAWLRDAEQRKFDRLSAELEALTTTMSGWNACDRSGSGGCRCASGAHVCGRRAPDGSVTECER